MTLASGLAASLVNRRMCLVRVFSTSLLSSRSSHLSPSFGGEGRVSSSGAGNTGVTAACKGALVGADGLGRERVFGDGSRVLDFGIFAVVFHLGTGGWGFLYGKMSALSSEVERIEGNKQREREY